MGISAETAAFEAGIQDRDAENAERSVAGVAVGLRLVRVDSACRERPGQWPDAIKILRAFVFYPRAESVSRFQ